MPYVFFCLSGLFANHTYTLTLASISCQAFCFVRAGNSCYAWVWAVFVLSSVCVCMHVRVRMCLRAWACDVVGMIVSGMWCSRDRLGIRVWGTGEGWVALVVLVLPDREVWNRGKLLELIPCQKFSSFSETLPMQHNSYGK